MECICKPCPSENCDGKKWKCMGCMRAWFLRHEAEKVAKKLAAIDRRENEEAWRKQAPELGIHPDMHVKKSEREALGFFEEDRFV